MIEGLFLRPYLENEVTHTEQVAIVPKSSPQALPCIGGPKWTMVFELVYIEVQSHWVTMVQAAATIPLTSSLFTNNNSNSLSLR